MKLPFTKCRFWWCAGLEVNSGREKVILLLLAQPDFSGLFRFLCADGIAGDLDGFKCRYAQHLKLLGALGLGEIQKINH